MIIIILIIMWIAPVQRQDPEILGPCILTPNLPTKIIPKIA